jgi:hypothetical protein
MLVKKCPGSPRSTVSRSRTRPQKVAFSGTDPPCIHVCRAAASFPTSSFQSVDKRALICPFVEFIAVAPAFLTSGASMITWLCRELASTPNSA